MQGGEMMIIHSQIKAPRGKFLNCRGWPQEAALRMLMNNLDPEVAEKPEELVVYGGTGKAARNWAAFEKIVEVLQHLEEDETLLVQSGKPVAVFRTQKSAPRVLIANSLLVPAWSTWEIFRELERQGLTMYGQMTAGSWIYIGTQGILQGTYETFAEAARQRCGGTLKGKLVLTAGLGGMGGAQPLAVTMNEGVCLAVEVDPSRARRRVEGRYCEKITENLDEALSWVLEAKKEKKPLSVALIGNAGETHPEILKRGVIPDLVTDQTTAHDELNGYIPAGMPILEALTLRVKDPQEYRKRSYETMARHVQSMLGFLKEGSVVFDYGNNIRKQAFEAGVKEAFDFPGFVQAFIRPLFCDGKGPFRWVALSGDEQDIFLTDEVMKREFEADEALVRWLRLAGGHREPSGQFVKGRVAFQGLPARICWLGYGDRKKAGLLFNELVAKGKVQAPIVIGRDHLDAGSVASPYRETEGMKDGSDAIADWPILNALLNTAAGAHWVSVHHGGGVGIGYSIHAGMVVVADGTRDAEGRLERVLTTDPGLGIVRHADAGYPEAMRKARTKEIKIPMLGE